MLQIPGYGRTATARGGPTARGAHFTHPFFGLANVTHGTLSPAPRTDTLRSGAETGPIRNNHLLAHLFRRTCFGHEAGP